MNLKSIEIAKKLWSRAGVNGFVMTFTTFFLVMIVAVIIGELAVRFGMWVVNEFRTDPLRG